MRTGAMRKETKRAWMKAARVLLAAVAPLVLVGLLGGTVFAEPSAEPVASAAPASPAAAGDETVFVIAVPTKAEVGQPVIRLGDIATITPPSTADGKAEVPQALKDLELSPAALPGQARYLSRSVIEAKLRYAGFDPSSYRLEMAGSVTVRTQSQVVTKEKAEAFLRPQVVDVVGYPADAVDFALTIWPVLTLFPGEVTLSARVERSRLALGIQSGLLVFPVDVFLNGVKAISVTARASLAVRDKVVVATRDLPRHHVVDPDDVLVVEKPLAGLPKDVPRDTAKAVGLRTTRPIKAGLVLSEQDLEPPPAVNARQTVWITVEMGGVQVTTLGEALEEGGIGQTIRVQNLESKKIIIARVTAPGQVVVASAPGA